MSVHVSSAVYKASLGGSTRKAIALKLADCANEDGTRVYPAVQTIADEVEVSARTVQRVLKEFVAEGLLIVVKVGGKGPKNTTEYRFNFSVLHGLPRVKPVPDKDDTMSPLVGTKGDTGDAKGDTDDKKGDTQSPNPSLPVKEQEARERAQDSISGLGSEGPTGWVEISILDDRAEWAAWGAWLIQRGHMDDLKAATAAKRMRVATRKPKPSSPYPEIIRPPSHIVTLANSKPEARV